MAAAKIIILCAIISLAMSFTIPEQQIDNSIDGISIIQDPLSDGELLSRNIRSPNEDPMRRIDARVEHHDRHGTSASVKYTHPIGENLQLYGQASRQFKYNDNSGHVGIQYEF